MKEGIHSQQPTDSELGLEVIPKGEGVSIVFTVSDGDFDSIEDAHAHYDNEIHQETAEISRLHSLMAIAGFFQAYQIVSAFREPNMDSTLRAAIPIVLIAGSMYYLRKNSIRPTQEKREVSRKKLEVLDEYMHSEHEVLAPKLVGKRRKNLIPISPSRTPTLIFTEE